MGSTEAKVAAGAYHFGVGVIETGNTAKENGLNILKTIIKSPILIIAKKDNPKILAIIKKFKQTINQAFYSWKY